MPNVKSAEKRVRTSRKRNLRNNIVKSQIRTAIKKFEGAMSNASQDEIERTLRKALVVLDKAVSKGVIHKNKAARKKSRLTKRFNQAG